MRCVQPLLHEDIAHSQVADGIKDAGVPRSELFLVSKLWNNSHQPSKVEADLDTTLSQLETDYLDVWLMHWPVAFAPGEALHPVNPKNEKERLIDPEAPGVVATWKEMVRVWKETKKTKAVGVSNFTVELLEKIIEATGVVPAMNQIELHPSLIQPELFDYCECARLKLRIFETSQSSFRDRAHVTGNKKGIIITAYSPLGNNITGKPRVIDAPEIQAIAKRIGKTPAQVLIAWVAYQGFSVIPKSVTPSRIQVSSKPFNVVCLTTAYFRPRLPAPLAPRLYDQPHSCSCRFSV